MEWPCGKCEKIAKHPYAHYYDYSICDGCEKKAEYLAWQKCEDRKSLLKKLLEMENL